MGGELENIIVIHLILLLRYYKGLQCQRSTVYQDIQFVALVKSKS